MESGLLVAISVIETRYHDGKSEENLIKLAADVIEAGIHTT